jgi:hypothetical protein
MSFGEDCMSGGILTEGGIRTESYPFDAIGAYACYIKHSLDTDFAYWLDEKYLKAIPRIGEDKIATIHTLYDDHIEMRRQAEPHLTFAFFNHHNLLDDHGRGLFERRIERYRKAINSSEPVVFVTTCSIESFREVGLVDYFKDRPAKTTIVYLRYLGRGRKRSKANVELVRQNGQYFIDYTAEKQDSSDAAHMICNILRNNF